MPCFRADLHIHSRYSRATSPRLSPALLAAWARIKGLEVLGTGDFTHPRWREELGKALLLDEPSGLYRLKDAASLAAVLPELPMPEISLPETEDPGRFPLFLIQGEISSIYKRGGKTRRVHNLVFMPHLEAAESFCRRLEATGNLAADGRPMLGLDSRDLLEMVLETHPSAFLVPAHIWTPWFSLFGSKSGFDSLEECFGDLAPAIFALETGLSSDPAMNRLWSRLDGCRLISNSDAHSGENLGREANVFAGEISYQGMLAALKDPAAQAPTGFLGTLEFYPEEGKYHLDGHRACNVRLSPEETRALGGRCPVCGGPVTVGVLHRVMELADRSEPLYTAGAQALGGQGFISLAPLPELLSEILGPAPKSRKVMDAYAGAVSRFGSELGILQDCDPAELARFMPPLGEAVSRLRRGEVLREGGYDGAYGRIRVFSEQERREILRGVGFSGRGGRYAARGLSLPDISADAGNPPKQPPALPTEEEAARPCAAPLAQEAPSSGAAVPPVEETARPSEEILARKAPSSGALPADRPLNSAQERAVLAGPHPVLVLAGPGSGKTRTLAARAGYLLSQGVNPRNILAVTFTRRAALELDERLGDLLGRNAPLPRSDTLHALALEVRHRVHENPPLLLSEENARQVFAEANAGLASQVLRERWSSLALARETLSPLSPDLDETASRYSAHKAAWNLADYTDLLEFWLDHRLNSPLSFPWTHVLADEIQDLSLLQLTLIRSLLPPSGEGFFGIGDPDQSIYGFRGAHSQGPAFFASAWPALAVIHLDRNYRSRPGILAAAASVLGPQAVIRTPAPARNEQAAIFLFEAQSAESEAVWLARRISALLGRGSHTLTDAALKQEYAVEGADYTPGDIAVLVRTHALAPPLRAALARAGLPVAEPAGEVFWAEPRIRLLLQEAGRMLGIAVTGDGEASTLPPFPKSILTKGPLGLAAYFSSLAPFDALFWRSQAFKALVRAYTDNGGWPELITWISLRNELELAGARAEKVQILSLHAAKGLEFGVVFLPCLEDGLLPFAGELLSGKGERHAPADTEEERRLFYVGLTRARDALFLSHAGRRVLYGHELRLKPSRFLACLPVQGSGAPARSRLVAKIDHKEKQLNLWGEK
jgi:uncharacterized protein (TIGR00375 family)